MYFLTKIGLYVSYKLSASHAGERGAGSDEVIIRGLETHATVSITL